mgnify:CR=1 FL=1
MLKLELLLQEGILILEPSSPLEAVDLEAVAHEIGPYLTEHYSSKEYFIPRRSRALLCALSAELERMENKWFRMS